MMLRFFLAPLLALGFSLPAAAGVQPFPPSFKTEEIQTDGATIHVRVGGQGPAVIMLHGFADTGDMWAPLAAELARDHTVIVPDLRGLGLSSHPETSSQVSRLQLEFKKPDQLRCPNCKVLYPIVDGIPVMLIEEAKPEGKSETV